MRKLCLSVILFWSAFLAWAQQWDTLSKPPRLTKTDIELTFSYYKQDGNNSAVTGGTGTEKLVVYAPDLKINRTRRKHSWGIEAGVDVISSASTDKIDFVVSSASVLDFRNHAHVDYTRRVNQDNLEIRAGTGFSVESDYFSIPVDMGMTYTEPSGMRTYQLTFQAFFDDLRWGRINPSYYRPVKLIYPQELRHIQWFDQYKRNSYNLKAGFTQVLSKRTILGIFPEITYQRGLLATPFHRVYFTNDDLKVENLPGERLKFPVGFQLNHFATGKLILKGNYQFYTDNFGITAHSVQLETVVKITPELSLTPLFRFYTQSGSDFFKPYKEHTIDEQYYTSDYDLSAFNSYKSGLSFRYAPHTYLGKKITFDEVNLEYSYYYRSNDLSAHFITFWIHWSVERIKKEKERISYKL